MAEAGYLDTSFESHVQSWANIQQPKKCLLAEEKNMEEALLLLLRISPSNVRLKVAGSEVLISSRRRFVQILGGYGFSADYPMDRAYRDSESNRICEGTNEITYAYNGYAFQRAMKGELI